MGPKLKTIIFKWEKIFCHPIRIIVFIISMQMICLKRESGWLCYPGHENFGHMIINCSPKKTTYYRRVCDAVNNVV